MKYIQKNKLYPADCKKEGVQGRVIVQLVVNKVGSISDANIIKSVNPQFDAEALRVVNTMFNRIPEKKNGNAYAH
jgi:TonB family protein